MKPTSTKKKTKKNLKKRKRKIILIGGLILEFLCLAVICVVIVFNHYYSASDYVPDDQVSIDQEVADKFQQETIGELGTLESLVKPDAPIESITKEEAEGTYNLLLIGVDVRNIAWHGNSDTMILVTVNHDTKKIYMTSFMRDLYADIPGYGVQKLNAAHAIGGGPLLTETLMSNYGVVVDNYARVDFSSLTSIIDIVGGVDIDVDAAEMLVANDYIKEMCNLQGKDYEANKLTQSGMLHLTGIQAVAYCRIRYVGNADFERTSRQREVLSELIKKAKGMGLGQLNSLINEVLPLVTHNVEQKTVVSLISQLPSLLSYEFVMGRVPYEGLFVGHEGLLVPNMQATIQKLRETLYANE